MSLASGRIEEEVLALERAIWQLPDLAERSRRLVALEQQLAASWMFTGNAPPPPPPVDTVPGCFASLAHTLYAKDPLYGTITITWDGTSMWTGCAVKNFFASTTCAAASSTAIHWDLLNDGTYRMRWTSAAPSGNKCPQASTTCAGTPNVSASQAITVQSCVPFRASLQISPSSGFVIYGNTVSQGVRVDLSDSPL